MSTEAAIMGSFCRLPPQKKRLNNNNNNNIRACGSGASSKSNFPLASKILVKNLRYSTSENGLHKEFSSFGQVTEVKLVKDRSTEKFKGYAFIQYTSQEDAMTALENMDHQILDGRTIYVEIARPGKGSLGRRPITSGPPKTMKNQNSQEQHEMKGFQKNRNFWLDITIIIGNPSCFVD
ncbi:hypothetical protein ACFE04_012387 [Oxalis oulophora]